MDGHMDAVDEWEMLESQSDGGVNSVPYSSTKTFAEVVAGDV